MGRVNGESWAGRLYMRRVSLHVTRALIPTRVSADAVTWGMIASGLLAALVLTVPHPLTPLVTLVLIQLQLLLDCIEPHYYHAEDGLEFVYMHFEGSNARELCRRITDRHGWLIRRDNNTLIGNMLYDMVRFYDENGVETDMQRSARIYRMFDLLLSPSAAEQSADTPVEQAIQYIRSHIGQPISVEELASTVCLSASYFAHMFKRRTGFSPADYVINSRIERAKVLLVRTQKPIAEIAEEVGYSTSGSLINLFVKKVGTSPRQYRIRHMSKAIDAVCKTDVPFIDTDVPEL